MASSTIKANTKAKPIYDLGLKPSAFEEVAKMIDAEQIAASAAGPIFDRLAEHPDQSADAVATELGLRQVSDTAPIDAAIDAMIASNPKPLQDYKAGKQ